MKTVAKADRPHSSSAGDLLCSLLVLVRLYYLSSTSVGCEPLPTTTTLVGSPEAGNGEVLDSREDPGTCVQLLAGHGAAQIVRGVEVDAECGIERDGDRLGSVRTVVPATPDGVPVERFSV